MNNQEVVAVLQECKRMLDDLASEVSEPSEEEKNDYQRCGASLPDDLRTLIQEAKEMKWPFVPEKWQYKQTVCPEDKTNLQDLINPRLHELLVFLKASIKVHDSATSAAIVFLIDRFLYWADASTRLLLVAKALHKLWPSTPIAPQVVIRQARISVNTGKLLKAEYILSSLISNNGATGTWHYSTESDRLLVQSVCIQIRGQILQKLGMWYEAAELIWTSIVGFCELPVPDKKGIATSLGVLADIFISMSEEDYQRFKENNHKGLTLLEEFDHRLLSAAEACKLAATFSLYTPLFVLTNLNIRGTCLLSYSLSKECPIEKKTHYLLEAKESFEIGLLTKKRGDQVTSKQELHSFVKSVFCLANVHKWLNSEQGQKEIVNQLCKEAMEKLAVYNLSSDKRDKGVLASDVICIVSDIKEHLKVQQFPKSDDQSFVPNSYEDCIKENVFTGKVSFSKLLEMFSQHHISVCKGFDVACKTHTTEEDKIKSGACITALKTTDTISTVDSSPSQTSDQPNDPSRRRKLVHSDAVSYSFDEERRQRLRSSHSGSQGSSLSNSTFSWECIPEQNEKEPSVSNSGGDDILSLSSSSSSDNVLGLKKYKSDIHLKGLSLQDSVTNPQNNDIAGENKSNQTSCTNIVTAGNKSNSSVDRKSFATGSSTHSDEGSFEFVDLYDAAETNIPTNNAEKQQQSDGESARPSIYFGGDLAVDTRKTTEDLFSETENHMMVPPGPSDFLGETQDTTDDAPVGNKKATRPSDDVIRPNIFSGIEDTPINVPQGPSGGVIEPRINSVIDSKAETEDITHDPPPEIQNALNISRGQSAINVESMSHSGIDQKAETQDATDDLPRGLHSHDSDLLPLGQSDFKSSVSSIGIDQKAETQDATDDLPSGLHSHDSDLLPLGQSDDKSSASSAEEKSLATEDKLEMQFLSRQWSAESSADKKPLSQQNSLNSSLSSSGKSKPDVDSKLNASSNSSHGSSSFCKISPFTGSFSESQYSLSSSVSSFILIQAQQKEQILQARSLDITDYQRLLSGVSHDWLLKRLEHTGLFKFKHAQKSYNALLLKFSKKSELWSAQETLVYIGKDLEKEGKHRKAFWISFLHQDETLGRYVGKAYKERKELLYHLVDVERQMTAQYYVTEFNKRLYEQNIPTQIFYIPSSVLLIMDDSTIKSCVSVEPYILGDFVKLTNNTTKVKNQYKATTYGLAFGHFAYEFSKFSDIVVDLQGWVTGSKKGEAIIYLTDPQIHSVRDTSGATCINFGSKGIYMFFSSQHIECNEICHMLSLKRPDIKELEKKSNIRTQRDRQSEFAKTQSM